MEISADNIRRSIWKYYTFQFLIGATFFSAVLVPFFTDWGHLSLFQIQLTQSWFALWFFLLEIPTGVIADYLGRKYSLMLGALVLVSATLVYGFIPRFEIFLIGEFLFALGLSLISGADEAWLYDSLKEHNEEEKATSIFGKAHSAQLWGILISAPIGSLIASKIEINAAMYLDSIPYFLAFVVACFMKEPQIHAKQSESKRYLDIAKKGLSFLHGHKKLRLIAFDAIIIAGVSYFVIWFYQLLLKNLHVPLFYFGFFHAFLLLCEIIIASNFGRIYKRFGAYKFLNFSAVATGVSFLLVALSPNIFTILIFLMFAGGFGLTRIEFLSGHINSLIPSEQRATVLSSISMFRRLSLALLNPFIGFIADHSLQWAFIILGLTALCVFFFSPIEQKTFEEN